MQLASTTSEQRRDIYKDIRSLLRPGFLAHQVVVKGVPLSLRSFVEEDFFILRHRVSYSGFSEHEWMSWAVASSIWMFNGQALLNDQDAAYRLWEMCKALPAQAIVQIYGVFVSLMKRLGNASERVEAFLYEDESRFLWKSEGDAIFRSTFLGGSGLGGWNPIQRLWVFYNRSEDRREAMELQWQLAAFQVGPHAPKGIKKVEAKNKKAQADLERRRQETMDRVYYEAKGLLLKQKEKGQKGPWQEVHSAHTEEELKQEMRDWVLGVKDHHDNVVDGIKSKIKHEVEKRREDEQRHSEAFQRALQEEGIIRSQLQPFTGDGAQEFLDRMRTRIPGTKVVMDDKGHNSAYDKYIRHNPEVGNLHVDADGNITSDVPVTEEMLEVLTKPKEGASLQDKVASRRPTLHYGDDKE